MIQWHPLFRLAQRVLVEIFAGELLVEVFGKIIRNKFGRKCVVAVQTMQPAIGIVQCGIKRTGSDCQAEFGDRFGQFQTVGKRLPQMFIFG